MMVIILVVENACCRLLEYSAEKAICNSIANPMTVFNNDLWSNFKSYLVVQKQRPYTIRNKIQYVKRFYNVLEKGDAKCLLNLSVETRQHAMKSLSSLSKYLGIYDKWQDLIKRYQLKWPKKGGYDVFQKIFSNEDQSYSHMVKWIKDSIHKLPKEYGNIILFNTLTGLRPDESYNAIILIKNKSDEYVDEERMQLLHYRFPNVFLRVSKKAYLSIINEEMLEAAQNTVGILNYTSIRKKIKKIGLKTNMYYCRKVFATYLRNNGIEREIIDLLQGRTPSSIFVNHYYRPDINEIIIE
jgi:intergrase/recombinase